jgi:Zn-dependent alcohol dehydrogenase
VGNISFGMTYDADPSKLVTGNKSIVGIVYYDANALKKAIDFLSRAKNKYPFEKISSHTYPLEDINKAFEEQDKGLVTRSAIIL